MTAAGVTPLDPRVLAVYLYLSKPYTWCYLPAELRVILALYVEYRPDALECAVLATFEEPAFLSLGWRKPLRRGNRVRWTAWEWVDEIDNRIARVIEWGGRALQYNVFKNRKRRSKMNNVHGQVIDILEGRGFRVLWKYDAYFMKGTQLSWFRIYW